MYAYVLLCTRHDSFQHKVLYKVKTSYSIRELGRVNIWPLPRPVPAADGSRRPSCASSAGQLLPAALPLGAALRLHHAARRLRAQRCVRHVQEGDACWQAHALQRRMWPRAALVGALREGDWRGRHLRVPRRAPRNTPADGALPRRRATPSAARPPPCDRATARGRHCPQQAICVHVAAATRRSPSASSCPLACRPVRRLASPRAGLRPGPPPECCSSAHGQSSRQLGEQVDLHHRRGAARCSLPCTGGGSGAAGRPFPPCPPALSTRDLGDSSPSGGGAGVASRPNRPLHRPSG